MAALRPARGAAVISAVVFVLLSFTCPAQPLIAQDFPENAGGLATPAELKPLRLSLQEPRSLPAGAAFPRIIVHAVRAGGAVMNEFNESVTVSGLLVRPPDAPPDADFEPLTVRRDFVNGVLTLTPADLSTGQISIDPTGLRIEYGTSRWRINIQNMPAWLRILPPLLAIGLAIILKDVTSSLILATFGGCLLFCRGVEFIGATNLFCQVMVDQVADADHASVILFTVLLGAMIGLMNDSGGTKAVVDRLMRYANTREKGMLLTWVLGLVVFFDDYANTLLIGGAMRPLSDRLKISRAKLAFLIDSTAAPVAGLALSTWTAFEIDQVAAGLSSAAVKADPGRIFFATIPFRLYPLIAIAAVGAIAYTGRDFGPMLKAERSPHTGSGRTPDTSAPDGSLWHAVIPVVVLVSLVVVGYFQGQDAYRLLLIASLAASTTAFVLPLFSRRLPFQECSRSWTNGVASMIPAIIVLVLAWAVSDVCRPDKLDTAGFIISLIGDSVRPELLPSIAFVSSGAIAVSIGSSFTTMALLVPMFIPLALNLMAGSSPAEELVSDPLFLSTVGAILAGAIFGDHCSPISDTTVLSSAAAGCDHLQHVSTQIPYAMLTAICSLLLGYLPIGLGVPWWICLPAGCLACVGVVVFLGQRPEAELAGDTQITIDKP
ncbi:MAG: Na+/H+ antiporter NhaC family protein [Planctomycetaceae bacterium]